MEREISRIRTHLSRIETERQANQVEFADNERSSGDNTVLPASFNGSDKPNQEMVEDARPTTLPQRRKKHKLPGLLMEDGRRMMREKDCYDVLGYSFPWWKKWLTITVIFWVQLSMNFNASVYPSQIPQIAEHFGVSEPKAKVSQMMFMISYALGCELWAPWSEELGRWPILQASLFLVNIWQILGGLAPNFGSIVVARALGGLSSAGGSVTLGITADMWGPNDQGYAVAFVVLSSVGGSALGPIFGGIMYDNLSWHWNFWIQLIFGGVIELVHLFLCWETRNPILMDREAKRRRKSGEDDNIWGPGEIHGSQLSVKEVLTIWRRPFEMFLREPIVLCLSLLSGFSDALIFVCMESFGLVFGQWGFGHTASGLAFVPVVIGYLIAYAVHFVDVYRQKYLIYNQGEDSRFAERRLLVLLFLAPLEAIGLFGFAWTGMGPHYNPWIAPMIFICCIAVANYSIYMATIDYMVAAYGPFSASATGGNGFARDLLAGISIMYATPMYQNIGEKRHLQWASTILGVIAVLVAIPIYVFYWKGPAIRARSKFAQTLAADRKAQTQPTATEWETEKEV